VTTELEAAVEDAYEFAKRWISKSKSDHLAGHELNRYWKHATTLSFLRPPEHSDDGYAIGCVPVFGGSKAEGIFIYDDEKGAELVAAAREGDTDADAVLCGFASYFVEGGYPLPEHLRKYVAEKLLEQSQALPTQRRGRNPHINRRRNLYIVLAIMRLGERGFQPTRIEATAVMDGRKSACSIISVALERLGIHLSEQAVAKVWHQYRNVLKVERLAALWRQK
jgi:hypothetical protein